MEWLWALISATALGTVGYFFKKIIDKLESIDDNVSDVKESVARIDERQKGQERRISILEKYENNGAA